MGFPPGPPSTSFPSPVALGLLGEVLIYLRMAEFGACTYYCAVGPRDCKGLGRTSLLKTLLWHMFRGFPKNDWAFPVLTPQGLQAAAEAKLSAILNLSIHSWREVRQCASCGIKSPNPVTEVPHPSLLPKMATLKSRDVSFRAGLRVCLWEYQDESCSATKVLVAALVLIQLIDPVLSIGYLLSRESPESSHAG